MPGKRASLLERFWDKVDMIPLHGCWEWSGGVGKNGYGKIGGGLPDHKHLLAHRASWEIHNGPVPDKACVLHRCDNRTCVNPSHLFLGTNGENSQDMVDKGRSMVGEKNPNRVLSKESVLDIVDWSADGVPRAVIAKHFGVARSTISHILTGRLWRNVVEEATCAR